MLPMANPVRPYAWGSRAAIAALQGREPAAGPEAELWMGSHPAAPSLLETDAGPVPLGEVIAADPAATLGPAVVTTFGPRLPYLLKVLAAEQPLSLQVHPSPEQAAAGFAREEREGIALDAPDRNYRDPYAKPELLCALEPFEALCGFREPAEGASRLASLGVDALGPFVETLRGGAIHETVSALLTLPAAACGPMVDAVAAACARTAGLEWAADLAAHHPGDPGVVIALLMHRVRLAPGEALYVPAGQPHSYLRGVGVEIMGSSDNVLRGGLTGKHVDVPELLRILSPSATDPAIVRPSGPAAGSGVAEPVIVPGSGTEAVPDVVEVYRTPAREFELSRIRLDGELVLPGSGPQVLLSVGGAVRVSGHDLVPGASVFATASSGPLRLSGHGIVFRAATPVGEAHSSSRSETSRSF
ncbi:mannose-6-phosphate isomerase, class I [Streptosporangium sp. KLBMP 9127]|nr:mannose-6-phosphate isomerase, class I [Streptosporangium sp. KLBMP 9127]